MQNSFKLLACAKVSDARAIVANRLFGLTSAKYEASCIDTRPFPYYIETKPRNGCHLAWVQIAECVQMYGFAGNFKEASKLIIENFDELYYTLKLSTEQSVLDEFLLTSLIACYRFSEAETFFKPFDDSAMSFIKSNMTMSPAEYTKALMSICIANVQPDAGELKEQAYVVVSNTKLGVPAIYERTADEEKYVKWMVENLS